MTSLDHPAAAAPRRATGRRLAVALAGLAVLAALLLPDRTGLLVPARLAQLPLEAPLLALLLAAAARGPALVLAGIARLAGLLLAALVVIKLADMGSRSAFGRPFDPVLDYPLIGAGWNLLSGSIGTAGAAAAFAGAALLVVALVWVYGRALAVLARAARRRPGGTALAGGVVFLAGLGAMLAGATGPTGRPLASFEASRLASDHVATSVRNFGDIAAFDAEAAIDPVAAIPDGDLFTALAGKDVLVVFVESYGRSAIEDPRYAGGVGAALDRAATRLAAAGLNASSGWLVSPTVGGQSWLAHGTLLAGVRTDNQRRYDRLIGSARGTLNRDFRRAGWRTVAVMPAIVMDWPESAFFGYDAIYDAEGLDYRGKPFNWVTMPDQYTLSAFDRFERPPGPRRPVMAEIALISSHAPWTPIPELIDWDAVGDGSVFDAMASSGDPPEVVWRDGDRVRTQYRLSLEYAVETVAAYLADKGGRDLVAFVVGDHQPAPLITGDDAGREVPMHVIAADPAVSAAIARWSWRDGLRPDPDGAAMPMEAFRERLVETFSAGGAAGAAD